MKTPVQQILLALAAFATLHTPLSTLHAQNTVVTYQALVQSGGEPFTGVGQFKFALLATTNTSATATATATVSGGAVTAINVTFGGSGYVTPPTVTIPASPFGSAASATANLSGGAVVSITVNNGGSGYLFPPTVTIAAPPPTLAYHTHWSNDGTSVSGSEPAAAVMLPVASGLFTARLGDAGVVNMTAFDAGLFAQTNLQLRLWFNDGTNGFAALQPPQPLSAAPYALVAGSAASLSGTYGGAVSFTNGANSFSGSGAGLTTLNASQLTSGTVPAAALGNAWKVSGNAGTTPGTHFLGTTDNQPLELKVNGQRALRLEPTSGDPNIIGGAADNQITSAGGGVLSGASHRIFNASDYSLIAGGFDNFVGILSPGSFIGGGQANRISNNSTNSVIGGGASSQVSRDHSFIGGGLEQTNRGSFAFIGGGRGNRVNFDADYSTIARGAEYD